MSETTSVFKETGKHGLKVELLRVEGLKAGTHWKTKVERDKDFKGNGSLPGLRRIYKPDMADLPKVMANALKALAEDMKKTPDPEPAKSKEAKPAKAPATKAPAKAAPAKAAGKKATAKKAPAKPTKSPVKDNGADGVNIDELI